MARFITPRSFLTMLLTASCLTFGTFVSAQQLGLLNNEITVQDDDDLFDGYSVQVDSSGEIELIESSPDAATNNFTLGFNLVPSGIADGNRTFNVGLVVDAQSDTRRLEILFPAIILTFTNNAGFIEITGDVDGVTATVLGRTGGGTQVEADVTISADVITFNAGEMLIDVDTLLQNLEAGGGALAGIIDAVSTSETYDYWFALDLTAGTTFDFGVNPGGLFIEFPTNAEDNFILNAGGGTLASNFTDGWVLDGTLDLSTPTDSGDGGGGGSSGGGGSGGGESSAEEVAAATTAVNAAVSSINTALAALATDAPVPQSVINDLLSTILDASSAVTDLTSGTLLNDPNNAELAVNLQQAVTTLSGLAKSIIARNGSLPSGLTRALLNTTATLAANSTGLSLVYKKEIKSAYRTAIQNYKDILALAFFSGSDMLSNLTLVADLTENSEALEEANAAVLALVPEEPIDEDFYALTSSISQLSLQLILAPLATLHGRTVVYEDAETTQALLADDLALFTSLYVAISQNFGLAFTLDTDALETLFTDAGVGDVVAAGLAEDLANNTLADTMEFDTDSISDTADALFTDAIGGTGAVIDEDTGATSYEIGTSDYVAYITAIGPAPEAFPEGNFVLADGLNILVSDGLFFQYAAAPVDIVDFAAAVEEAADGDITTEIGPSGTITLTDTVSEVVLTGVFSSAPIESVTATDAIAFEGAVGDPASIDYAIVVQFADGSRQDFVPQVANIGFYATVDSAGFPIETDRSDGVIDIDGFEFRADFFTRARTTDEILFRLTNANENRIAIQAADVNGDGITDYNVITSDGVQTIYTLP